MSFKVLAAALLLMLSACGGLPRPFEGWPGSTAARLAQPPPARLVIAEPSDAMLPDAAVGPYVHAMTEALTRLEVPAIEGRRRPGDWRLELKAEIQGQSVIPLYTVFNGQNEQMGIQQGQPVPQGAWSAATAQSSAEGSAQGIADLLSRIEAARRASDPASLVNRQARLRVPDVVGAPGDGNRQLARQMRLKLSELGLVVQDAPGDFSVTGEVKAVPQAGKEERIEVQWSVVDATGDERGHILQLNEVPEGSLDRFWGDVAVVVAQEAAVGVRDVIVQQTGAKPAPK